MKFKDDLKTIFLDEYSEVFNLDEKVNLILSPSLYWVKKLDLPVKYLYEVKSLIPSLFEDILPDGNYSYTAYKSNEKYFIFAYEDKIILDLLHEKGISLSQVNNIHLSQSEFQYIETALKINDTQSVCIKDELLILVPCSWIKETRYLNLDNEKLSKHTIALAQFNHILDKKSLYTLGIIFSIMILLVSIEWFISSKKINEVDQIKEEIFSKYKLKPTVLQNKVLLKKYTKIHTRQMKIREYISSILAIKLKSGYPLSLLSIKNRLLSINFNIKNQADKNTIINFFKSKEMEFKSSYKENKLFVEIKL